MWRVVLCFALLFGASSLGMARQPQDKTQKEQSASAQLSANTGASTLREARPDKDPGCQDRQDQRGSDLCAQWGAVDAARSAAEATWAAVLLSFAGTVLIGGTFIHGIRASTRELRAYISVKPKGLPVFGVGDKPCATVTVTNGGVTPAYEVEQYGTVLVQEFPLKSDPLGGELERHGIVGQSTVHRGDEYTAPIYGYDKITRADVDDIRAGRKVVYLIGNVDYRDTFRKTRRTEFCYFLDVAALNKAGKSAKEGEARGTNTVEIKWTLGNLHTKAT